MYIKIVLVTTAFRRERAVPRGDTKENCRMISITKWLMTAVAFAALGASTVGCNTIKGAGKDIERGGEKVQGAAEGVQEN